MKHVTPSEARRNWFRLLDEVAAGQTVVLERKGRRIVLAREDRASTSTLEKAPSYRGVLQVPDVDKADLWSWEWSGPGENLNPIRTRRR